MAESKVTRRLTIKVTPNRGGKFAVTFNDGTTRAEDGKRVTTGVLVADSFDSGDAPLEGIGLQFKDFKKSIAQESEDDLFGDQVSARPKLDD